MTPSPALPREGQPGLPGQVRDHLVSPVPCLRPSVSEACVAPEGRQPIETAPTDREILVFNGLYGWYRTRRVDGERGPVFPLYGLLGKGGGIWFPVPTFWMELPPTPEGFRTLCGITDNIEHDLRQLEIERMKRAPRRDAADTEPHGTNELTPESAPGESADPQSQGDTQ